MAKLLYLHGMAGGPGGPRVEALRERGHDVFDPILPYAGHQIQRLLRGIVDDLRRDGRLPDVFAHWTELAHNAFERYRPDLVVGISLGGAVAMRMNIGDTPAVLMAPPWTGRFELEHILRGAWPALATSLADWMVPLVCRFVAGAAAIPPVIRPATVVIHSAHDEVVSVRDSEELLRRNLPRSDPERVYCAALERALAARGHRPHDQRLLVVGSNHRCVCAPCLKALADAVDVLLLTPAPKEAVMDSGRQ